MLLISSGKTIHSGRSRQVLDSAWKKETKDRIFMFKKRKHKKMRAVVRQKECWKSVRTWSFVDEVPPNDMVTTKSACVCVCAIFVHCDAIEKSASTVGTKRFFLQRVFLQKKKITSEEKTFKVWQKLLVFFAPTQYLPSFISLFPSYYYSTKHSTHYTHTQLRFEIRKYHHRSARREIKRKPAASRMKRKKNTKIREFQLKLRKMFKNKFLLWLRQRRKQISEYHSHDDVDFLLRSRWWCALKCHHDDSTTGD